MLNSPRADISVACMDMQPCWGLIPTAIYRQLITGMIIAAPYLSITEVGVVRPNDNLCIRAAVFKQILQRVEHVLVAEVPRAGCAVVHL